ncbi:MAG TPA: ABC transporter permease, partial [Ktedonobacteraceae bacterium]|nr:ABC transporter permease [Ktedonobacteraceae bacterium]
MKNGLTDNLIAGLAPNTLTALLVVLTGLALLLLLSFGLNRRLFFVMGARNMLRCPGHTLVLLCGLMLSTALMTAAPGINESLAYSASAQQLASVGQLDEAVTGTFSQAQVVSYLAALRAQTGIEAASALAEDYHAAQLLSPRTGFSRPGINVLAAPADFDRVFGPLRTADGQAAHFADLHPGQIYLGMTLAQNFAVHAGDRLTLSLAGQRTTVTVA